MRKFTTLAMVALLAACKPAADKAPVDADPVAPAVPEAKADGPNAATTAVSLDGEGLRFIDTNSGKTSLLAFGVPRAQAETALANVAGQQDDRSTNAECGIAIGTTRAKAAESVSIVDLEDSTLGEEFSIGTGDNVIGGMFAAPGDTAKIDALFAGTNCFFR